jgi:hypothetical protein
MADRIKNYSLGSAGVILDPHHLLPGVPPEGLTSAQNATHDPAAGFGGAIRKRPGFARFNMAYAGGVILGGISMPIADSGGTPAGGGATVGTGDVADGTSVGTGDKTGGGGGTFDGGLPATLPAGAGAFSATTVFGGARLILIGLDDNVAANDGGRAWYLTSKNFADVATKSTVSKGPCMCYSFPTFNGVFPNGLQGQPSCIGMDGRLYYAASHGNQATGGDDPDGTLPIYVTDGGTASLLATIPRSAYDGSGPLFSALAPENSTLGGDIRAAVMSMHAATDGFIYITVKDKYTGQSTANSYGRIFRLRPTTGELVEWNLGAAFTPPYTRSFAAIPYCCSYYIGYLFVGEANKVDAGNAVITASNGTEGVTEFNLSGAAANNFTMMCQFNGRLFAGTGISKAAGPALAFLYSRGPSGGISGGTAWSSLAFDVGRTGNATNGNSYVSMVVYDATTAFLSWHAPSTQSKIYKVVATNPGHPEDSTSYTFTSVFASGAGATAPLNLYIDQGVIYAISSGDSGSSALALVSTDGGTTWTDKSASFGALGTASFAIPVFYAVNQ